MESVSRIGKNKFGIFLIILFIYHVFFVPPSIRVSETRSPLPPLSKAQRQITGELIIFAQLCCPHCVRPPSASLSTPSVLLSRFVPAVLVRLALLLFQVKKWVVGAFFGTSRPFLTNLLCECDSRAFEETKKSMNMNNSKKIDTKLKSDNPNPINDASGRF